MKYLYRKVKDADGKHVRIQKNFNDAVALANHILQAWNDAKDADSLPDRGRVMSLHAGNHQDFRGYDLRLGPDLMTTAEKDSKGGLASWLIGQHQLPVDDQLPSTPTEQPVVEQKPVVQNSPVEEPRGCSRTKRKPKKHQDKHQDKDKDCKEGSQEENSTTN